MSPDEARRIVALSVVLDVLNAIDLESDIGERWADYPELGEHDWVTVTKVASNMIETFKSHPKLDSYDDAYRVLSERADK